MRNLLITVSCSVVLFFGCDKKAGTNTKSGASETSSATSKAASSATGQTSKTSSEVKTSATVSAANKKTGTVVAKGDADGAKGEKTYPGCIYKEDGSGGECPSEDASNHGQLGGAAGKTATAQNPPGHYGMKFLPVDTQTGPLAAAIKTAETNKDKVQRFTGTIGEVCQKKGCWFVLQDGVQQARVMMRGVLENDSKYFRIPIKSTGKKATIEGKLVTKVFSEANVKHIEFDAGRDPEKVSGSRKEFVIQARAVKIDG